ncbi:MAG: Fe-S cluster assembly protein SufD [Gammaproteobacteria bacterium]|nr:MAG: Fe-S cluster assembly protein SufD [Gammaproteobacteria bacterium]
MNGLAAQLAAELPQDSGTRPDWFKALRDAGAKQFRAHGLPTRKDETWKYTGLGLLEQHGTQLVKGAGSILSSLVAPVVSVANQIHMLDGCVQDIIGELPAGVTLLTLEEALSSGVNGLQDLLESLPQSPLKNRSSDGFSALNTATLENGMLIHVAAGTDGGRLLLAWSTTVDAKTDSVSRLSNSRICLILEAGANLELLEQFETPHVNTNTSNIVVQAELGEDASLQHVRLQQESDDTGLITRTEVAQQAGSGYTYYGFDFGGGLVRHDLHCSLLGSAARTSLNGAYLLDGKRHVDNHAKVDHMAADGFSEQYFRGVVGGSSKAVFNTAVYVHPGADGTEAKQSNANILLSKRAEIDTRPELEIYADEVVASHGATVGQLDEQAVFYLRSRGLNKEQARQILTTAFCRTVCDKLADRQLADAISQRMMDVMPRLD